MNMKKDQVNTDDKTTKIVPKNTDGESTVSLSKPVGRKSKETKVSSEEMKVIRAYWTSGSAALKRQAVSRYGQMMGLSAVRAEAALNEWVDLLEHSK